MVEWDRGFTSSSLEYKLLVDERDMEEFRSEKSVKTGKVIIAHQTLGVMPLTRV